MGDEEKSREENKGWKFPAVGLRQHPHMIPAKSIAGCVLPQGALNGSDQGGGQAPPFPLVASSIKLRSKADMNEPAGAPGRARRRAPYSVLLRSVAGLALDDAL